jgi:AcrR family transcriptional regulator
MPAQPKRRTQAERRAATEEAVMRAAAELIAELGIERTSLRGVGERAGVSRAMPAYHFGSKDGLITRIAERGHDLTLAATAAALEQTQQSLEDLPKLDALRLVIDTFLRTFLAATAPEERAVVVMWGATFPADSSLTAMIESDRETLRYLSWFIAAAQEEGSVRADIDADAAATVIMGMARGVAALSLTHSEANSDSVRELCGTVLNSMLRA